eukprot:scpid3152/ scgid33921/ Ankyrin and armadillo repeat-containing protein
MASRPPSRPGSALARKSSKGQAVSPGAAAAEAKANARKEMERRAAAAVLAAKEASIFFERYEKAELQEALTRRSTDWLLSIWDGSCKHSTEMSDGLAPGLPKPDTQKSLQSMSVSSMQALPNPCSVLLIEHSPNWEPLKLRELQQLIRELVVGIYVFNQLPCVQFDALPNGCTSVSMPHAYQDTRLGQIMIEVSYHLQCFLYGTHFSGDKRSKFVEKWQELVSQRSDITTSGHSLTAKEKQKVAEVAAEFEMETLAENPAFVAGYQRPVFNNLQRYVGHTHDVAAVETQAQLSAVSGKHVWKEAVSSSSLQLLLVPKPVKAYRTMIKVDADWTVNSSVRLPSAGISAEKRAQLQALLQEQRGFAIKQLTCHPDLRVQLRMLRFATCVAMWLTSLRKQFFVPDVDTFLPALPNEHLITDRELPPIFVNKPAPCAPISSRTQYVTASGGGLGIRKAALTAAELERPIAAAHDYVHELARECRTEELFESSPTPLGGKQYYVMGVMLEKYYPTSPKVPRWIHALYNEMNILVTRVGMVTEQRAQDQFRRHYGDKKAGKLKQISLGLVASAQRGLAAVFESFSKRCAESRVKQVDPVSGLSLLHHAALNDRANIISILLRMQCDIDQVSEEESGSQGSTALHYSAQCGHLDTVSALLMHGARPRLFNSNGFASIHLAAMANSSHCVELLFQRDNNLLELTTQDGTNSTPLLLAVENGCLDTVKLLMTLGSDAQATNSSRQNAVHLAARHRRICIIKFFTEDEQCREAFNTWDILSQMLSAKPDGDEPSWALSVLVPLAVVSTGNLKHIVEAGLIAVLIKLMRSAQTAEQAIRTVRLIGTNEEVQKAFVDGGGIPVLVALLSKVAPATNCHAAVLMADLLETDRQRQAAVAQAKALPALVQLLDSSEEHILLCVLSALALAVAEENSANQAEVCDCGGFPKIVALLSENHDAASHRLFRAASKLIVCLCTGCPSNQLALVEAGGTVPLLNLVQYEEHVDVQTSAASAIRSVALNNDSTQQAVRDAGGVEPLKRLMKNRNIEVKVFAATAVWAVAGRKLMFRQLVASQIGIDQLITLCELQNEALEIVGTEALCSLAHGAKANQEAIAAAGGVLPVVRLLRSIANSTEPVLLRAVETIGILCIGPAMCPNTSIQEAVSKASGLDVLVQIANRPTASQLLRAKSIWALACVTLKNTHSCRILAMSSFRLDVLLTMWHYASVAHRKKLKGVSVSPRKRKTGAVQAPTSDGVQEQASAERSGDKMTEDVHLYCGRALITFAFGNTHIQKSLAELGGLNYRDFKPFMDSADPSLQAYFDLQVVVVSPILHGADQVSLAVEAIRHLVDLLDDENDEVQMLAADCLASLVHTRAGIPATVVKAGGVDALLKNLTSPIVSVLDSAAAALGYLSFDPLARRVLLKACRDMPFLVGKLFTRAAKISQEFLDVWDDAKHVGIPTLSLEANGGVPLVYKSHDPQPDFNRKSKLETQVYSPSPGAQGVSQGSMRPMRRAGTGPEPSPWYKAMQRTAERARGMVYDSRTGNTAHLTHSVSPGNGSMTGWRLK